MKQVIQEIVELNAKMIALSQLPPEVQESHPDTEAIYNTLLKYADEGAKVLLAFSPDPEGEATVIADNPMFTIMVGAMINSLGSLFANILPAQDIYRLVSTMLGALIANGTIKVVEE